MMDDGYPSESSEDYEAYKARVREVKLPDWITLPPDRPVWHLEAEERDGKWVVFFTEEPDVTYNCPTDTYHLHYKDPVVFGESVYRSEWCDIGKKGDHLFRAFGSWYTFNEDGSRKSSHAMFPATEPDQNFEIKQDFYDFLSLDKFYHTQPDNWVTAYQWLYAHPVFWTLNEHERWNTDVGLSGAWITVSNHSDDIKVLMEHGPHIVDGKAVGGHYMDHRLDVWAANFEDAYVAFAKKVDKYYDVYGEERQFEGDERENRGLPEAVVTAINNYTTSLENGDLDCLGK